MPLVYTENGFDFTPVPIDDDLVPYLHGLGYAADSATNWAVSKGAGDWPILDIAVKSHIEVHDHTWYVLCCTLVCAGSEPRRWRARRRLQHLRALLHDPVRQQMDARVYSEHFSAKPFASYGGLPGTTERLDGWLTALAGCINAADCTPSCTAHILRFLEPLDPTVEPEESEHSDYMEFARVAQQTQDAACGPTPSEGTARGAVEVCARERAPGTSRWFWWLVPDVH